MRCKYWRLILVVIIVGIIMTGGLGTACERENTINLELLDVQIKQSPLILKKKDFDDLSPWQKYVTPYDSEVRTLASSVSNKQEAYSTGVSWLWVSDQTLNGKAELWLMPHEFLVNTPGYPANPAQGRVASDCEEQAYTLVSLLRAFGISAPNVRVTVGKVNFGGKEGGHAWVEIYENGRWLALEATSGPYWNDSDATLHDRSGYSYDYFKTHSYPSVEIWGYFNEVYYYNPSTGESNAPNYW